MIRKLSILLAIMVLGSSGLYAQRNMNLYGLDHLTQAQDLNPAFMPDARFSLGLGTGMINLNYVGFFSTRDVFSADMTANEHIDLLIGKMLDGRSEVALAGQVSPFNLGFRVKKSYFNVGASFHVESSLSFPPKVFDMLWNGNSKYKGENVEVDDLNIGLSAYSKVYAGLSFPVGEKLHAGIRLNYLMGHANVTTTKMNGFLYTDDQDYSITANLDAQFNMSNIPVDYAHRDTFDVMNLIKTGNTGFGADIGLRYEFSDAWEFSGSLLNLGSITWEDATYSYASKGEYTFEGFDPVNDSVDPSAVIDTLVKIFTPVQEQGTSYKTGLRPEVFLGAKYRLSNGHEAGSRIYMRFIPDNFRFAWGFNYKLTFGRWFYLNPSYAFVKGAPANLGLGVGVRALGLDLHFVADNLSSIAWDESEAVAIQFGLQFTFKPKKPKAVQPVQFF